LQSRGLPAAAAAALFQNRRFLNFVAMLRELITKNVGKIDIVEDNHIGVVFLSIIVLPPFVPPTEADYGRPSI
jgi:hypothetical protein